MYKGKICEIGPTEKVLCNPQHSYTSELLADRFVMNTITATEAPEVLPVVTATPEPALVLTASP